MTSHVTTASGDALALTVGEADGVSRTRVTDDLPVRNAVIREANDHVVVAVADHHSIGGRQPRDVPRHLTHPLVKKSTPCGRHHTSTQDENCRTRLPLMRSMTWMFLSSSSVTKISLERREPSAMTHRCSTSAPILRSLPPVRGQA